MKSGDLVRLRRWPRNEPSERLVGLVLEELPWPRNYREKSRRFRVMFPESPDPLVLEESRLEVVDGEG